MSNSCLKLIPILLSLVCSTQAFAVSPIVDNFMGGSAQNNWAPLDDACMTAGNGSGTIPACTSPTDTIGHGALRLTPAQNYQTGAIISDFTFPTSQGLQVTFTTYTYGGDSGGTARDGADGIGFFLTDGNQTLPPTSGALGGSLGYSCSNVNNKYDGLQYGYLGLGIDEYGNFLNSGDNTATGILNTNASGGVSTNGTNSFYDSNNRYYQPNRIGLRGAGNVNWAWLNAHYPNTFPASTSSADKKIKVQNVCKNGSFTDVDTDERVAPLDYAAIPGGYWVLPSSTLIANESASTRTNAIPITYKLMLTPAGLLTFMYSYNGGSYQPVLSNQSITASNGPIPSLFRFGFSAGTGGSNNVHEITCFQAAPTQSSSSVGANTIQSGEVKTGTQIYLAYYNPNNWWGSLVSESLVSSGGTLTASTVANWDGSCTLTGGACPTMGTDSSGNALNTITATQPASRTMLTWSGAAGIPFEWSDLTSAQQSILNSTDNRGQTRLNWLRGDRTQEQLASPAGPLRARTGVLGDIIDSSPTVVGAPSGLALPSAWVDMLYPTATVPENSATQTYSAFVSANATRTNVVYTGSNDGLLHGFRSGSYNANGTYNSTNNDGQEVLAYMPSSVLANSNVVGLTSPTYSHNYFVDATPIAGDLFYGGSWHTWLVGGLGMGGKEIYALDITDPIQFAESNAASLVKGDWTSATLGLSHLGNTVGTPIIERLHNGQWAIIFGNGLNSGTTAGVYIGLVDPTTGAVTFRFLDTGVGSLSSANGITSVASADLDNDHVTDYLYAGDLNGNVWRFNLTSSNPADWAVSKFGKTSATPLFITSTGQPITTAVAVASSKIADDTRVMVLFGTGQKTPATSIAGDTYATGSQTFYGIWDWDMGNWDTGTTTANNVTIPAASVQYATLSPTQTITRTDLLAQTVASQTTATSGSQVLGYRSISASNEVCWKGSTTCGSNPHSNTQYGWYFDLPATNEQIIYNPVIIGNAVVVNTAIPPVISANQCNPGLQTGWTMAFDVSSGGGLPQGFFPDANGSYALASDGSAVSGLQLDGVGTPYIVTVNGMPYLVTQTSKGNASITNINPQNTSAKQRVSWRELVNQ